MLFKKAFNPEAAIMKNRKKYLEPKKLTAFRCFKWVVKMQRCVASGEPIWNEQFVRPQIPAHEKKCYFLFFLQLLQPPIKSDSKLYFYDFSNV